MLNNMMENESKYFCNNKSISVPFIILFIMKLIARIKIHFFPKFKVYVRNIQVKEITHCYQNLR